MRNILSLVDAQACSRSSTARPGRDRAAMMRPWECVGPRTAEADIMRGGQKRCRSPSGIQSCHPWVVSAAKQRDCQKLGAPSSDLSYCDRLSRGDWSAPLLDAVEEVALHEDHHGRKRMVVLEEECTYTQLVRPVGQWHLWADHALVTTKGSCASGCAGTTGGRPLPVDGRNHHGGPRPTNAQQVHTQEQAHRPSSAGRARCSARCESKSSMYVV